MPPNATQWSGYPVSITAAQALNAPGTLPNVVGTVVERPMVNPGIDFSDTVAGRVVGPGTGFPNTIVAIKVLLPPSYFTDCTKHYPVVYHEDGQWAFDDFIGAGQPFNKLEMELDEILSEPNVQNRLSAGIGEFILVAIPSMYTPTDPNRTRRTNAIALNRLPVINARMDFLINTIKPTIDSEYRTLPQRDNTVVTGVSASGAFAARLMFTHPEFASRYLLRDEIGGASVDSLVAVPPSGGGPIAPSLAESLASWTPANLANVMNTSGMKVYFQRGQDATVGGNLRNKQTAILDKDYLLNNGFTLSNGTNFNSPFLLIDEPLAGVRGDSHNFLADGSTFVDGLLRLYNQSPIPVTEPFHMPRNPSKLDPPQIISQSATSARLLLALPSYPGYNYGAHDMFYLGVRSWKIFKGVVDPLTGVPTYDSGTLINANTLAATDPSLYQGAIRTFALGILTKTTNLEWTVQGLDPTKTYTFKACAGSGGSNEPGGTTSFTLCEDATSDRSLNVHDLSGPAITLTAPADGAVFLLNQANADTKANYSCADEEYGSGLDTCVGTVPSGSDVDTSTVGSHSFTVDAKDNAGNTSSKTVSYSVVYDLGARFLPPIDNPTTVNMGKAGRTYPVKFQLRDVNGALVSALSAVTSINHQTVPCGSFGGSPTDALPEADATGGTALRFDGTQYIFNWKTPSTQACYNLFVTLDSGQVLPAYFDLGK